MLDWDEEHEMRIFRLASLPAGAFEESLQALTRIEQPRWPVWVPLARSRPTEEVRSDLNRRLEDILNRAAPPEWLIAWTGYGEQVLAARKLPARELVGVPDWFSLENGRPERDWFADLALAKIRA